MVGPLMGADADPRALTINVKNVNGGPLGDVRVVDPRAPTINAKKHRWRAPLEAVPKIRESSPSTLRNVDDGPPLGGLGAGYLGASTINAMKQRQWAPWEVLELEI
jgi:hypothetical protein